MTRPLFPGGGSAVPLRDIDRQLIDRCLGKEPGAWNDFVERYMGLIYHVIHHVSHARSTVLSAADIEDIAAEVFLGIVDDDYGVLRRFRGASSLPTYLTVVARRIAVKEVVKRHREAELGHLSAHRSSINEESAGQAEAIATAEEVERMLENLPEREAEVVRLYHLKYLNYRQISKQLGIPENSVGPILAKARQRLRRSAEQRSAI
jgi:RNA polymerase sigma-70 factor (ECF subfamily)